jgi:Flp pilus assembly protein TadB
MLPRDAKGLVVSVKRVASEAQPAIPAEIRAMTARRDTGVLGNSTTRRMMTLARYNGDMRRVDIGGVNKGLSGESP